MSDSPHAKLAPPAADQSQERIVGALAVYESPDVLADALVAVRKAGLTRLDTVSPYPLHGLDHLLGKQPSRLGYVAAIAGISATAIAKSAQWWTSAVDYPLNIGGSPLFSLPAFIPVTFELMVLFASIATVLGMLAVFNGLPQYGSALLRSEKMKALTCNRYGIVVDARDRGFEPEATSEILGKTGAISVELLKREEPSRFYRERILSVPFLLLLLGVAILSSTATRMIFRYGGEIPPYDFMKRQPKLSAQQVSTVFPDGFGTRTDVRGTVARGSLPYAFSGDPERAGQDLINPFPASQGAVARGRAQYGVFCQPCHGKLADGRGTLTTAFPKAPTLHSRKAREWSDGRIYAVLTEGQNIMPAYVSQISGRDRWQIIVYLRALQRSQDAPERDLQ